MASEPSLELDRSPRTFRVCAVQVFVHGLPSRGVTRSSTAIVSSSYFRIYTKERDSGGLKRPSSCRARPCLSTTSESRAAPTTRHPILLTWPCKPLPWHLERSLQQQCMHQRLPSWSLPWHRQRATNMNLMSKKVTSSMNCARPGSLLKPCQ